MANAINTDSVEVWKPIPGWDGYEASSFGRVRSVDMMIAKVWYGGVRKPALHRGRVLSSRKCSRTGYFKVSVSIRSTRKSVTKSVHQLVCLAFHGEKPDWAECVAHNNGNRDDNTPDNLRWATNKQNAEDRIAHGTNAVRRNSQLGPLPDNSRYLEMFRRWNEGELGKDLAKELGVHKDTFYRAYKRHLGNIYGRQK